MVSLQSWFAYGLVGVCTGYSAWRLMPQAAQRSLALGLLHLPLPAPLALNLRLMTQASPGCKCSGCTHSTSRKAVSSKGVEPRAAPLVFHPRHK